MTSLLQDYRVQEHRFPSPPSFKCNVLRESLSEDSQNIPCATTKSGGVAGNLCTSLVGVLSGKNEPSPGWRDPSGRE
jgi:hypothetical protein